jgi:hypothetical protein
MTNPAAPASASELETPPRKAVTAARRVVVGVATRLPGFDIKAARRNAWEAVCADRERRRQWDDAAPVG